MKVLKCHRMLHRPLQHSRKTFLQFNKMKQVVKVKVGCGQRKPCKPLRRVRKICKRAPIIVKKESKLLQESVCIQFQLTPQASPQLIWTAVDIHPTGSLLVKNESAHPLRVQIKQTHGGLITQEVKAHSELGFIAPHLQSIYVACEINAPVVSAQPNQPASPICIGTCRLHLFVPLEH